MSETLDLQNVKEHAATLQNRIEQERAFTIERVERLARFTRGENYNRRVREEWEHFVLRTGPMQQELDLVMKALADYYGMRSTAPVVWRG